MSAARGFPDIAVAFLTLLLHQSPNGFEDTVLTRSLENLLPSYDFIIVGGGSAGSTLANRLSEVSNWNVLLIEAGGQENAYTKTPAMWPGLFSSEYDWKYKTAPQKKTCQSTNGQCIYPRGKLLGGSSSINAMIYARGYRSDYDQWGKENCGWSFKDVEPYFIKSEGNQVPGLVGRGKKGPLTVTSAFYKTRIADQIVKAGLLKGLRNTDCSEYEGNCIIQTLSTIRDGARCSTSTAFLEPISTKRSNLHIITKAEVSKVIVENGKANGVEFIYEDKNVQVLSTKEVVLAAGAINSPKILMLSGIGPAGHLKSLGIKVLADLPVGDNLQDHTRVTMYYEVSKDAATNLDTFADKHVQEQYAESRRGPYSFSGVEAVAWVTVGQNPPFAEPPNIQFHLLSINYVERDIVAIASTVARPKSRGTVRLNSSNLQDVPLIDVNFYSDDRDWQLTVDGLKFSHELFKTEPLVAVGAKLAPDMTPNCANISNFDEYLNCNIREYTSTVYHPVGTAKMGSKSNGGVVNSQLQVHGINGLRVIDASIAPTLISMNTNPMAIMIGEKGADIIKAGYGMKTAFRMPVCKKV